VQLPEIVAKYTDISEAARMMWLHFGKGAKLSVTSNAAIKLSQAHGWSIKLAIVMIEALIHVTQYFWVLSPNP